MHYANGRAAKAGDVVRGKGYNIKHEIVGLLIAANPGATACNCTIATVTKGSTVLASATPTQQENGTIAPTLPFGPNYHSVIATTEYGQLDAFVAIDPTTGEVLAPEQEEAANIPPHRTENSVGA